MYMLKSPVYGLSTLHGASLVLQSVTVDVVFNNLLCETAIIQTYSNQEQDPIEAVYTFPLSMQAVLLDVAVRIGERTLRGQVVKKAAAEERYEEAIAQGDAAIMLEQGQPGLYTMNLGNILAGEQVVVTIKTAELHSWNENSLRFSLPTTIAPRYGDPEQAGLQPHQVPETDLLAEHRLQITLHLTGVLAQADVECPSHQVAITAGATATIVHLATGEACMDRDFILNIRLPQDPPDTLHIDHDVDDGWVALASFVPQLPTPPSPSPKSIKIVVDCSGSMAGDSINQARQAISDILSQLRAEDWFNVILFGATHRQLFDSQVPATSDNITKVRRVLRTTEADMGGTEMEEALVATVAIPGPATPQDILLITDGEVWRSEELVTMMRRTAHRVFAVGVGSAVAEDVLRRLAQETGGACELVSPREGMAEKIVRHFQRILLPRAEKVLVRWPIEPLQVVPPVFGPVFHSDTLHVFARFSSLPNGPISLEMRLEDGGSLSKTIVPDNPPPVNQSATTPPSTLARMAIARSLMDQDETVAADLAVRYQLVSPYTNALVVDEREPEHKVKTLPKLRKVEQMLAAGWGGAGTVVGETECSYPVKKASPAPPRSTIRFSIAGGRPAKAIDWRQRTRPGIFVYRCNSLHTKWFNPVLVITRYEDLIACDLPDRILSAIKIIADQYDQDAPEDLIVLAFLYTLSLSPAAVEIKFRFRRALRKAITLQQPDERLLVLMARAFTDISEDDWGPNYPLIEKDEEDDDAND